MTEAEDFLTRREVLGIVKVTSDTLRSYIRRGDFPAALILGPKSHRWRLSEVVSWMETRPRTKGVA